MAINISVNINMNLSAPSSFSLYKHILKTLLIFFKCKIRPNRARAQNLTLVVSNSCNWLKLKTEAELFVKKNKTHHIVIISFFQSATKSKVHKENSCEKRKRKIIDKVAHRAPAAKVRESCSWGRSRQDGNVMSGSSGVQTVHSRCKENDSGVPVNMMEHKGQCEPTMQSFWKPGDEPGVGGWVNRWWCRLVFVKLRLAMSCGHRPEGELCGSYGLETGWVDLRANSCRFSCC